MENIDQIEKLLQSRTYQELTVAERELVNTVIDSAEEYAEIRKVNFSLSELKPQSPVFQSSDVWRKIKHTRQTGRAVSIYPWYAKPIPSYAAVALVMIVGGIAWFSGSLNRQPLIVEKTTLQIDTVFLAAKPDTIVKEKIVYRTIVELVNENQPSVNQTNSTDKTMSAQKGVTMLDKEELGKLLVSGSR
ncbi:MAG: hypothetical protein ING84_02215 [Cytophagales bacterium]|nr:hypothetical protein [Cytophagales bacterium]MCA6366814.1 hypothetical protein [Cytophagales bacterium]MCA6370870.1 hypothetical protein [Cytophagales bacterium]MCA6375287.1 hypothetical protein [Cytophagales bacterium]MCA6381988.1 hypothetical protein [Cytophagales bacterium]